MISLKRLHQQDVLTDSVLGFLVYKLLGRLIYAWPSLFVGTLDKILLNVLIYSILLRFLMNTFLEFDQRFLIKTYGTMKEFYQVLVEVLVCLQL